MVGINLLFTLFPLTNLLHYESSALNAILISLISGLYWLRHNSIKEVNFHFTFLSLLLLLPLAILLISTLLCQKCPLDQGFYFFLIFTIPAIFIGIAISLFSLFISSKFRYLFFILIWILLLLGFAPELYLNPQIYFYNSIFVYYPGVIYDQNIEISATLLSYRGLNLLISMVVIFIFSRKYYFKRITKLIIILAFISAYLHSYNIKVMFGFSTDVERINESLSYVITNENFDIYIPDSISENERKISEYDHQYYYHTIANLLQSKPKEKIKSFLFKSGAHKKHLFGSGNADVAKPWLNQIYLNFSNYRSNLKHELAHIFSAEFGRGPLKIPPNLNPGIIEGFAMAVENNFDNFDIDHLAALAFKNNYKVKLKSLFSDFSFFASASSLSYIYAGSFFKYLSDLHGWEKLKKIYSGESFEDVYDKSLSDLVDSYYDYINSLQIIGNSSQANYYFGYRPLIKRFCARATAKELKEARNLLNSEQYQEAASKYLNIYNYSSTYSSLVGYANAIRETEDIDSAIKLLETELNNFKGSSSYYYLQFLLADFYAINEDSINSSKYYGLILDQNPHRSYYRSALLRNTLLRKGDSTLIKYLTNKDFQKKAIIDLLETEPNEYFVEHFIGSSERLDFDYESTIEIINKLQTQVSFPSYTNYRVSEYAYRNMDLKSALAYSKKSLINVMPNRKSVLLDHFRKLEYIVRNK